jgi:outer membrane receptor protein involved in Fe transport
MPIVRRVLFAALVLVFGVATLAAAQGTNGVITGLVADPQGGILPGVTVTVRNVDTGVIRTVVTEPDGRYRVPALPAGRYDVRAELQGFTTAEITGLTLTINQELRQDVTMTVGALQETITVTAQAPVIEPTTSEVAAVITQEQIATLPIANRSAVSLSLLLPGTSQDGSRPRRNNAQVGAGTLQFTTNHLVDGTMNMSTKAGEPRQDFPQSAIREFKVLTSQAPAEYGGRAGGVVSVITRGGTNRYSGEAYEFFRNKHMSRLDLFKQAEIDRTGADKPQYERHQFGGALGGPIVRDRIHFFIAAEQTREEQSYQIITGRPEFYGAFEGIFPNVNTDRLFFVRGDGQLTPSQNLFVRWARQGATLICEGCGGAGTGTGADATGEDTYIPRDSFVAGHTWVLGARLLNEARFQWAQQWQYTGPSGVGFYKRLDFTPERVAHMTPIYNFPSFSWGGGDFFVHHSMIREFRDDFSVSLSRHNVKFGGSFQNLPLEEDLQGLALGTWTFAQDQPFDPANLNALRGPVNTFTAAFPWVLREQAHHYYQVYAEDDWKVRDNITLNVGLRYERDTKIWNEDRDNNTFYPRPLPFVDFASRGDNNNVSPRLGLAWDVLGDGRTVVRAAAGRQFNVIMNGTPGNETTTLRQTSITIRNPSYPDPYGGRSPESFASTAPPQISIVDDRMENPYSDTYSLGFSRELMANMALHADGVYTDTEKFNASVRINTPRNPAAPTIVPYPEWGVIQQVQSVGWQKYRALLVRLEKRFSQRNQYTVSYTLSKVTDNSFGDTSTGNITDAYNRALDEGYGNADRRHTLVASGAILLPWDLTLGAVWTGRTSRPFSARAGRDLNADGANTDFVPGTHKGQGNRDLDLGLVNTWRAANGLGPISADQIDSSKYNRTDVRISKAITLGGSRRLEIIGQVFNLFGVDNLGGIGVTQQTNALSNAFGQILGAQPRQQAEIAVRTSW